MLDHIRQYYLDEKSNAIPAFIAAAVMLLLGVLLYFRYGSNGVAKGMGTGFVVIALLGLFMGISTTLFNSKKLAELEARSTTSEQELRTSEGQRMDKVMNVTFRSAFITFGVLMMAAMLLIILTRSDYWRGIGIALMVLVALVTVFDSFNMRRNREYLGTVAALKE